MIILNIYIFCLGLLALITIGVAYRSFFENQRPGSRTFGFLMLAMAIWAFFYLLEIVLPDLSQKIIARKILHFGMTMSAPFWLAFALRYTKFGVWWEQYGRSVLLLIPGAIAFLLGATNEFHRLIWQTINMPNSFGPLQITYGIGFWVYTIISYVFIALGFLIYLIVHVRSPKSFRWQTSVMLLAALTTATANAIFLTGIFPANIDPTPLSFALSAPLLAVGFFRFGIFNLYPIAAPIIIENLRDAVVVTDEQDRVTNLNLAAKKEFNLDAQAVGSLVFDILPKTDLFKDRWELTGGRAKFNAELNGRRRSYDLTITRLRKSDGVLLGRVIVFHDITQEQRLLETEFRHSTQMRLLEQLGRKISDSLAEKEILQYAADAIVNHFGYAEAAICLLTKDNQLETAAIAGTHDFGYKPPFAQKMGVGVIGHAAEIRKTYIANEVAKDPYYFSNAEHYGSALGVPLFNEKVLLGVLYIESLKPSAFSGDDVQAMETLTHQVSSAIERARLYARTREHLQVMSAVQAVSQVVSSSLDLEKICASVVKALNLAFIYTYISIYLLKDDDLYLSAQIGYDEKQIPPKFNVSQGVCGKTVGAKKIQFIEDVAKEPSFLKFSDDIVSEICVPLLKEGEVLGVLNVEGKINSPLTQQDADMLNMLAGPIALAVDNARLHAQLKVIAMTDAVTGLYNRHAFEATLRTEIERATRTNVPLSLIIFDLDSFKVYNDAWGHPAGDVRLKATADLVRKNLRRYDVAARYGGDEFAVILPGTECHGALQFAKRLVAEAQKSAPQPAARESAAGYTLSVGVATFPEDGDIYETLLLAADHAELIAKRRGKNRFVVAREIDQ